MKRQSGVLLPVFSLPGPYGCGTLGKQAFEWIDFLKDSGFSWWQVLPLGITDSFHSPYSSCSSFGGDPLLIDPGILAKWGLITEEELKGQEIDSPYLCDYDRTSGRIALLKTAAKRFDGKKEIDKFLNEYPVMREACTYFALRDQNGGKPFSQWSITRPDENTLFEWQFIQYVFHRQWHELKKYAAKRGISIMGDMPFYPADGSFDVWYAPKYFQLDPDGNPASVAGVPPDYFAKDGQKWGNPLYNWTEMEKDGFSYWKERLSYALTMFDGVRIDHFRALSEYWSIPAGAETAKVGKWVKGPGKALIDAIRPLAGNKLILAEDLGIIDDKTRELLKYSNYPGMAVFQFGFDGDPENTHLPHNYKENLVAYTGTHDNNTLLGFFWEMPECSLKQAEAYLAYPSDKCRAAMSAIWMSPAFLTIAPVQDLLGYGADTRINTPGVAHGNWSYRVTSEQIRSLDSTRLNKFNHMYGRGK